MAPSACQPSACCDIAINLQKPTAGVANDPLVLPSAKNLSLRLPAVVYAEASARRQM